MDHENMEEEQQTIKITNQIPNILITGTPGVGKTTIARLLCEYVDQLTYINLGDLVREKKLYKKWDVLFDVPIFDEDMVCDELEVLMQKGGIVIDFHTSGFFPQRWFDLVILLRCNNTDLYDRLKARGYNDKKITENIECEILEVTSQEVYESYDKDIIVELYNEKNNDQHILCLGLDNSGKSSLINRLKTGYCPFQEPTRNIKVSSVEFNGQNHTIYEIGGSKENREIWQEYIQNTRGLIYVIDGKDNERFSEQRQYLQQILENSKLQEVPLLIYVNKISQQQPDLKGIIKELNLHEIQDRELFIQGCDIQSGVGVNVGFDWISKAIQGKKQFCFEAEPRVIKGRGKFQKEQEENSSKSQQTFALLMQDKKVKMMNPVQQEQEYVRLEKERIKIENMNFQLINFKKNKKKMAPYDIKPSPNPKIDVNLEFFLTDNINTIPQIQTEIDCQTDDFLPLPTSSKYIPKKTGIDASTQVEDYELFDFNREVTPIVDIIVTKTMEQSMLEIEQDEEIIRILQKCSDSIFYAYLKFLEGSLEEWTQNYNTRINTLNEQLDNNEITEEQKTNIINDEFPLVSSTYFGINVNKMKKIGFSLAHSQYYNTLKKDKFFNLDVLVMHKDGRILHRINPQNPRIEKYIRYKKDIRDIKKKIADDDFVVIDFQKVPSDVWGFLVFVKMPNLNLLDSLKENEILKFSRTGVQEYQYSINVDNFDILDIAKIEDMIRQPENDEQGNIQNGYLMSYVLTKRQNSGGWFLETIKQTSKGFFTENEENEYIIWGIEFYINGKKLEKIKQLKKCINITSLEVRAKPEPIPEKEENIEDENNDEREENNDENEQQQED
ncbi:taf9 RNA polymerase tata box binding protein -associated isoform cra_b, putative [Ichthyophthirius multifiliis]|uniref:Adenylate kinase isoenzyme 6 homolog n=1 Tax=Ichthyophthirius multifiliis TaxID=5932 RepID=G0QLR8_ICHMU|nr:taf9 RNA polymerase tata box binding protein -associated isoform cra_b, putative [Ichthyophthirius multifiliis]EGR33838.1 taf9 RNA polymerase tata box binding protein -associated isoform cra_b, putative [Ichthyophthirius multifiliis]|eukprot:XP_004039062.1 taf9 RNA polymerase tata box binding protein -associated isoform cra_b, putative [Ichthyophthirius multifiliis]